MCQHDLNGLLVIASWTKLFANLLLRADEVEHPDIYPKKSFIVATIDKEIRLSFAKRIRETLPGSYHHLIPAIKEKDIPDFKFKYDGMDSVEPPQTTGICS